jgi:hypothetical protein
VPARRKTGRIEPGEEGKQEDGITMAKAYYSLIWKRQLVKHEKNANP